MGNILLVEDDKLLCATLKDLFRRKNISVTACNSIAEARQYTSENRFIELVLLDVNLPDGNGLKLINEFKALSPPPEIIIITGKGDPDGAELAIKNGAWSYIEKSSLFRRLPPLVESALEYHQEHLETLCAAHTIPFGDIVGSCELIKKCQILACQAARSDANVLITGESGTGKEIFAQTIHGSSSRKGGKLVVVDCAALPETLAESILFGHSKGAFTDANSEKSGLIHDAHKGTLFLDEIGELPLKLQKIFLRVLQERRFRPIGYSHEIESDFRLIAATNKNLPEMIENGEFREDLFFRLRAIEINLPPLRERGGDLLKLTNHLLTRLYGPSQNMERIKLSHDFLEVLKSYSWPGNVRELYHALEKAVIAAQNFSTLYAMHLPDEIRVTSEKQNIYSGSRGSASEATNPAHLSIRLSNWKTSKEEFERKYLRDLLITSNKNIAQACQISGLSRARLYQLINKHESEKSAN